MNINESTGEQKRNLTFFFLNLCLDGDDINGSFRGVNCCSQLIQIICVYFVHQDVLMKIIIAGGMSCWRGPV